MTSRTVIMLRALQWLMKQEMLDDDGREILSDIEGELELEKGETDAGQRKES